MSEAGEGAPEAPAWTGERYLPAIAGAIGLEHWHRYFLAAELAAGKDVLDIACGEGYGAAFLAARARRVIGVDVSTAAVAFARHRYRAGNLEFLVGDCTRIPLPDAAVDMVVSFETLEHLADHGGMMRELRRVLRPGGVLCISSPDRHEYTEVQGNANAHHVRELYRHEFEALLRAHFQHVRLFGQRVVYGSSIAAVDAAAPDAAYLTFDGDAARHGRNAGVARPVYLIALASDAALPALPNSLYQGAYGSLQEKEERIAHMSVALQEQAETIAALRRGASADTLPGQGAAAGRAPAPLLVVTHDAHPHGAQYHCLEIVRRLRDALGVAVEVVCLGDGTLKPAFAAVAPLHDLDGEAPDGAKARELAHALRARGHTHALVNTTVSGLFLATLSDAGIACVALVHEMGGILASYRLSPHARAIAARANRVVFAAPAVRDAFNAVAPVPGSRAVIRPQGLYKRGVPDPDARARLRTRLGLPMDARIVLGVGFADRRKGADLFAAAALSAADPGLHFVWVGHWGPGMQDEILAPGERHESARRSLHFVGHADDTSAFYNGADVFALTSREDPYPAVVLEAMQAGLPVAGFAGAGGCDDLITEAGGVLVPMGDVAGFVTALRDLLADAPRRADCARRGRELVAARHGFLTYLQDLLLLARAAAPRVSVVVPNYNYARYLRERIGSLLAQTRPPYEIIFLDDASSDDSVAVARDCLAAAEVDWRVVESAVNAGSVFAQWRRGVALARGEVVWIAEADDTCDPAFLATVIRGFEEPGVVLAYCQSRQIDGDGGTLGEDYLEYVADLGAERWRHAHAGHGAAEIARFLAVKNTIPNVSGVLMKRAELQATLDTHADLIARHPGAGDWVTYVLLLAAGDLAFFPQALNAHRRHGGGVVIASFGARHLREIAAVQAWIARTRDCDPDVLRSARAYLERLRVQFGVSREEFDAIIAAPEGAVAVPAGAGA